MGTPALLAAQSRRVLTAVNNSATALHRYVQGGSFGDNGSAAAGWVVTLTGQTSGPVIYAAPGGRFGADRAATGVSVSGTFDAGGSAKMAVATIIADVSSAFAGSGVTYSAYWKEIAAAPTSYAELAAGGATDAEISGLIGHESWVVVGHWMVNVTGATAVSIVVDPALRSGAVEPGFAGDLAVTEEEFNG